MNNIIFDRFSLKEYNYIKFYDNKHHDFSIHIHELRKTTEDIYRYLFRKGYIAPNKEWIIDFKSDGNEIEFSIDLKLLLETHPHLDTEIRNNFDRASVERWKQLLMIAFAERK